MIQGRRITEEGRSNMLEVIEKTKEGVHTWRAKGFKKETINNFVDISKIEFYNEDEVKNSVIGRGIVGGLLLGGVGAIVGGMSGINRTKSTYYMVIHLKDETEILYELYGKYDIKKLKCFKW